MHQVVNRAVSGCLAGVLAFSLVSCNEPPQDEAAIGDEAASEQAEREAPLGVDEGEGNDAAADETFIDVLDADGRFAVLLSAIETAGLTETLSGGEHTLLAPTDAAFEALPPGTVDQLLLPENREQLVTILRYHVLENAVSTADVQPTVEETTLAGDGLVLERSADRIVIGGPGGALVINPDVKADNGIIHVIDQVLLPPAG